MKIMCRVAALLLVCLMIVPLWACTDKGGDTGADSSDVVDGGREDNADNLPDDLDFDGEEVVVYVSGEKAQNGREEYKSNVLNWFGVQASGDKLLASVWARNVAVEQRLNIKLSFEYSGATSKNAAVKKFGQVLGTAYSSGNYFCDIVSGGNNVLGAVGYINYFKDISDIPYVDWEQPWWWSETNEALSMTGESRHLVVGDALLADYGYGNVVYYNRNMYDANFQSIDEPYDWVLDGSWTYEKFSGRIKESYRDVDGQGFKDKGDKYGIAWSNWKAEELSPMIMSTDIVLSTRDASGKMVIDMDGYTMSYLYGKFWDLIDNEGAYVKYANENPEAMDRDGVITEFFAEGKTLFQQHRLLAAAEFLTNMTDEFGILPIPKLDENQEQYAAGVETRVDVLGVVCSTPDEKMEVIGATLEALSSETHRKCVDYFVDTVMKNKYSRESKAGQTIDIVMESMTTEWLNQNTGITGGDEDDPESTFLYKVIYQPFREGTKTAFTTLYAQHLDPAQAGIDSKFDSMYNQ